MPTINEYKKSALNAAGYSGSISDAEYKWLRDICYPYTGSIPDMWRYALSVSGYTGPLPVAQAAMLKDLGYTDLSISNKWYKYWRDTPLDGIGWWLSRSELDLDFANDRAFNRSTWFNGSPNSLLTYTSPSPKLVYGDDGVLGYAPHNLVLRSQAFDNASWVKTAVNTTGTPSFVDVTTAPDGSLSADKLIENSSSSTHSFAQAFTPVSGFTYTISVYLKASERGFAFLGLTGGFTTAFIVVDLATGIVTTATGSPLASSSSASGNGWYRVSISATATSASASSFDLRLSADGLWANRVYTGDNASGVFVWGAQLNLGSSALTYVPTTSAAVYSLPIDHDPVTLAALGVLIEEQRTNLLTYSQEFDNAAWTKNASYISATNITAPDDTATAELFVSDTNNAIHYLFVGSPPSITSGVTYTGSVFLKKGTGSTAPDWMQLSFSSATFGSTQYANFNLTTGEVGAVGAGATATVEDVGGGWYRCSITATATSTSGGSLLVAFTNNNDALGRVPAYADATTSNVCVWGAQLEAGAFPTSYIPTVASQVTRAADQVSILTSAFGFSATAGTLVVSVTPVEINTNRRGVSLFFDASNRMSIPLGTGTQFIAVAAGVTSANLDAGNPAGGQNNTIAVAFTLNDFALSLNAGAVSVDLSGAVPSGLTALQIGHQGGLEQLNGHIKRLTYFPTRKTDAELQELSA